MSEPIQKIIPTPKSERTQGHWILLNTVIDPEIGVGIVDLGLIYQVVIEGSKATVYMTLTSMGCPAGEELTEGVRERMLEIEGIEEVEVVIVWEPIWGQDMVDDDIRQMLWGV